MNKILLRQFTLIVFLFFHFSIHSYSQLDSAQLKQYDFIADQITQKTLTEKIGYEWLRELCNIGPRLSGSENSLRAIYWAEEKLKNLGVNKVWLQPVMVPHWERGKLKQQKL